MDIPNLNKNSEKAKETARDTVRRVKAKLSILPDRFVCPECLAPCEPDKTHDPVEGGFYERYPGGERPSWYCKECDTHYRREEQRVTFDVWE